MRRTLQITGRRAWRADDSTGRGSMGITRNLYAVTGGSALNSKRISLCTGSRKPGAEFRECRRVLTEI